MRVCVASRIYISFRTTGNILQGTLEMKYLREYFNFLLLNSFIGEILKRQSYKKSFHGEEFERGLRQPIKF